MGGPLGFFRKSLTVSHLGLRVVEKLHYAFYTTFFTPIHLWLCFCSDFIRYQLTKFARVVFCWPPTHPNGIT